MLKSVTIFGPNLSHAAQTKGSIHVHAANCGDCSQYGPGRKYGGDDEGWTIAADSRMAVVHEVYPPEDFDYEEGEWKNYDDLYVAPCVMFASEVAAT